MPDEVHTMTAGAGATIIRGGQPLTSTGGWATYDVELEGLANEARQWLAALSGAVNQLVADAEKPQRDSSILAMQTVIINVNNALDALKDEVYRREVQQ